MLGSGCHLEPGAGGGLLPAALRGNAVAACSGVGWGPSGDGGLGVGGLTTGAGCGQNWEGWVCSFCFQILAPGQKALVCWEPWPSLPCWEERATAAVSTD